MNCKEHNFEKGIALNSLTWFESCIPGCGNEIWFGAELVTVEKCINCGYSIKLLLEKNPIAEQIYQDKLIRTFS